MNGKSQDNLKLADVTPVIKKNPVDKTSYRPVSDLPTISKSLWKNNWTIIFKTIYLHICVDTGKVIVHNKLYLRFLKVGKKV